MARAIGHRTGRSLVAAVRRLAIGSDPDGRFEGVRPAARRARRAAFVLAAVLAAGSLGLDAQVTPDRLLAAADEPQN